MKIPWGKPRAGSSPAPGTTVGNGVIERNHVFRLDPALEPTRLAAHYRARGRLHLPGILERDGALTLYRHLAQEARWSLVLFDGRDTRELKPEQRTHPDVDRELAAYAYAGAQKGFQFLYEARTVENLPALRARDETLIARFVDFLNSAAFVDFAQRLTGADDIAWADAQATCYRPGHFLTMHDDRTVANNRRAAYVFNFTPEWNVDWGGLLQFIDGDGHVAEAYVPRFNALNIFTVPQLHSVSCVAPFARGARYSVTGWLRSGSPS
jgi:SM-20-related protein